MATPLNENSGEGFTPPGIIAVSPSALKLARDFDEAVNHGPRGKYIVTFHWSLSISIRRNPDAPSEDIGACLTLGAYERHQIPREFIQTIDGLEFAMEIPGDVWKKSTHRLIDLDETLLFKLALR